MKTHDGRDLSIRFALLAISVGIATSAIATPHWYYYPYSFTDPIYTIEPHLNVAEHQDSSGETVAYVVLSIEDETKVERVRAKIGSTYYTVSDIVYCTDDYEVASPFISRVSSTSYYVAWTVVDKCLGNIYFLYSHFNGTSWNVKDATLWPSITGLRPAGYDWDGKWIAKADVEIYDDDNFAVGYSWYNYDEELMEYAQYAGLMMMDEGVERYPYNYPNSTSPDFFVEWHNRPALIVEPTFSYHKGICFDRNGIMFHSAEWQPTPTIVTPADTVPTHAISGATNYKLLCTNGGKRYVLYEDGVSGIVYKENTNAGWSSAIYATSGWLMDAAPHPSGDSWDLYVVEPDPNPPYWDPMGLPPAAAVFTKGDTPPGLLIAENETFEQYGQIGSRIGGGALSWTYCVDFGSGMIETPSNQVFTDDFDDLNLTGWTTWGGTWTASNGYLAKTNIGNGEIARNLTTADGVLTFDYRITDTSTTDWGRVRIRVVNAPPYDFLYIALKPGSVALVKKIGSTWTSLATTTVSTTQGQWYTIRAEYQGANVTVWRSSPCATAETQILSTTSAAPTTTTGMGFGIFNASATGNTYEFDNIIFTTPHAFP